MVELLSGCYDVFSFFGGLQIKQNTLVEGGGVSTASHTKGAHKLIFELC